MLTQHDLEQIRSVIRDEIERALHNQRTPRIGAEPYESGSIEEQADDAYERGRAFMRALIRVGRGEPGAEEAFRKLHAKERLHDELVAASRTARVEPAARRAHRGRDAAHARALGRTLKERARAAKRAKHDGGK
jgi:hypothetical protein